MKIMLNLIVFASATILSHGAESLRWSDIAKQHDTWHSSLQAREVAETVLLYQQPNGAWAKNIEMARKLETDEAERIRMERGKVQTTIDNGATWTQLRFLARMHQATKDERHSTAFVRGFDYLLEAQYGNGGWPMIHPPPANGYYKQITFNDGAMIGVMRLLRDASSGSDPFAFLDAERLQKAARAVEKATAAILKSQVVVSGRRTVWCAQHDRETLAPCAARSYELPSLSGSESVGIVRFLMEIERPSDAVVESVEAAVAWFERSKLTGIRIEERSDASLPRGFDRVVVSDPSAPPVWARFYDLETNHPMFVGRDGMVKSNLADIEHERRTGYSWLGPYAQSLLEGDYPAWRKKQGRR